MSPNAIVKLAAEYFGIRPGALTGPSRKKHVSERRFLVMLAIRDHGKNWYGGQPSFPEIGRSLGNRDHTSIQYGVRRASQILAESRAARVQMEALVQEITGAEVVFRSRRAV